MPPGGVGTASLARAACSASTVVPLLFGGDVGETLDASVGGGGGAFFLCHGRKIGIEGPRLGDTLFDARRREGAALLERRSTRPSCE